MQYFEDAWRFQNPEQLFLNIEMVLRVLSGNRSRDPADQGLMDFVAATLSRSADSRFGVEELVRTIRSVRWNVARLGSVHNNLDRRAADNAFTMTCAVFRQILLDAVANAPARSA